MKTGKLAKRRKEKKQPDKIWNLNLYVLDRKPTSVAAVANLTRICHECLGDKCRITVIDIEKNPEHAKASEIVATPTLVKTFPLPVRRFIGDLSNTARVLAGLDLPPMIKGGARTTH